MAESPFATNLFGQRRDDVGDWASAVDLAALRSDFDTYELTRTGIWTPGTTFPASPVEGDLFYETDTDKLWAYDGTAWVEMGRTGAWTAYTPTLTQSGAVAKTVNFARWTRYGRTIVVSFSLSATASGTAGARVLIGTPVNAAAHYNGIPVGAGILYDASANNAIVGTVDVISATTMGLRAGGGGFSEYLGAAASAFNLAVASTDFIGGTATYEAAAST